jgi:hypothetical protein
MSSSTSSQDRCTPNSPRHCGLPLSVPALKPNQGVLFRANIVAPHHR